MKRFISFIQPFLVALQFLTIMPVRLSVSHHEAARRYSLVWYPLVAALIGLLLAGCAWLGHDIDTDLMAVLLLLLWITMTGGLHLDGLADTADAWIGGHGDRERTLSIMKDASCGPIAVTAIVMLLLLKYVGLSLLLAQDAWFLIFMVPVFARLATMVVVLHVPYVRADGLGSSLAADSPRMLSWGAIATALLLLVCLAPLPAMIGLALTVVTGSIVVVLANRRLGGMTGDIYGALIEITEAALVGGFILSAANTSSFYF